MQLDEQAIKAVWVKIELLATCSYALGEAEANESERDDSGDKLPRLRLEQATLLRYLRMDLGLKPDPWKIVRRYAEPVDDQPTDMVGLDETVAKQEAERLNAWRKQHLAAYALKWTYAAVQE